MKKVLVVGLDVIAKKNHYQFNCMNDHGYRYEVVCSNKASFRASSKSEIVKSYNIRSIFLRVLLIAFKLLFNIYNHVEIYAAGRGGFFYILLAKLFRAHSIVVERGDIGSLASYDIMTKFSLRLSYRWADAIWYKEPYMKFLLEKLSHKPLFFIHNAVPESDCQNIDVSNRTLDLLWANRDVPQREFGWVVKLSKELEPNFGKALFVGVNSTESPLVKEKVEFREYTDMSGIFERAKFFLLPSSIAFGNFALLEAMSKGTIPIVTECEGIDLLIKDGVNGFVSSYEYNAYVTCVKKALQLKPDEYSLMSRAAQKTIAENFSVSKWAQKLHVMYAAVSAQT